MHPIWNMDHSSIMRSCSDPRLPPYPIPTVVYAAQKVHVRHTKSFILYNVPANDDIGKLVSSCQ